ncbi:hypothetical protein DNHGIG_15310 [Collibacillus ludicampi]|uniref:Uncharacterized protein n=1 Tax=Collibacillus ludicampi TaxID=2771369 RepID=A0AAV4LDQ9_9BACL|nr:hypothetical protein [Collibacillus ludicampi]GIM45982.1 hypothetical protein DNHGIG_15310 [Collibacillus ludicampi]
MYAPLLQLKNETQFRQYYIKNFCTRPIITHDGFNIVFRQDRFDHAFFKSQDRRLRDKSEFDWDRAQRMDWIKKVLQDPHVITYQGFDNIKYRIDPLRRVSVLTDDMYAVIIEFNRKLTKGFFITAFMIHDKEILQNLISKPLWSHPFIIN